MNWSLAEHITKLSRKSPGLVCAKFAVAMALAPELITDPLMRIPDDEAISTLCVKFAINRKIITKEETDKFNKLYPVKKKVAKKS